MHETNSDPAEAVTYLTTTQLAKTLHVDTSAVRRWVAAGKIRAAIVTPGGHYRFRLSEVEADLKATA